MSFANNKRKLKLSQTSLLVTILITFIFFMNYTSYAIGGSGLLLPFNNATWIGFAAILLVGFSVVAILGRIKLSIFHAGYAGCLVLLLFPLLYSDTSFLQYEYMTILGVFAALTLIFIISQYSGTQFKRSLLLILYISTSIQGAWGLIQYYFIFEPNILFLGAELGKPAGTFGQTNVFSTYLNLGSLLSLYFFFNAKKQTKVLLILTLIVLVMNAHLNVLAQTKTSRVISLIAIGLYLTYLAYEHRAKYLPFCLLVLCIVTSFMPIKWFDVRPTTGASELVTKVYTPITIQSVGLRPFLYQLGIELAWQKPISGHGIGQVRREFAHYAGTQKERFPKYNSSAQIGHIHNEPLNWVIQLGFLSGLAFVAILGIWIWGLKTSRLDPHILLLGLPFVGHSLLEFPFHASAPHLLVFAIILGLSITEPMKKVKLPKSISKVILPVNTIICFQIVTFMLTSLASSNVLTEFTRSEQKDISILDRVSPTPLFTLYFNIENFEYRLDQGFKSGQINKDDIFSFIAWAEQTKDYLPMNKIYIRLAQSYIITQDIESANRVMDEALLIFPDDEQVTDMVARMKAHILHIKRTDL
jgi:O-antigen ligase